MKSKQTAAACLLSMVALAVCGVAARGAPIVDFIIDTTPEWEAALIDGRVTAVDSWWEFGLAEIFPGEAHLFVEPFAMSAADGNLVLEFSNEQEWEIYGISYNYPEDPDLTKREISFMEAEIDKDQECTIVLKDKNAKKKSVKVKADGSGEKISVKFRTDVTKKSDVDVENGSCEELRKDIDFDITQIKEGKGSIYAVTKKKKKMVNPLRKLGELNVTPEPTTFSLATFGLLSLLTHTWRRRKRAT